MIKPAWTILLLGGSSGVGKTTVARHIAQHFGISWVQVDDFRMVLERTLQPEQYRGDLHFFHQKDVWQNPPELLCQQLIRIAQIVSSALEIVIASHVATATPLVLEGDGILPALAVQKNFTGLEVGEQVRAVFLYEPVKDAIFAAMVQRGRGFEHLTWVEQQVQAEASWLYSLWLYESSVAWKIPVVEARPRDTVVERILTILQEM